MNECTGAAARVARGPGPLAFLWLPRPHAGYNPRHMGAEAEIEPSCQWACAKLTDANCLDMSPRECDLRCTALRRQYDDVECREIVDSYYECAVQHTATCAEGFPACAELESELNTRCNAPPSLWNHVGLLSVVAAGLLLWWRRKIRRPGPGHEAPT